MARQKYKSRPATMEDAFLWDIIEHPADDAPRLVYADWLEEDGRPDRAEFIRVQIELAGMSDHDPRRPELERRWRELLEEYEASWLPPLPMRVLYDSPWWHRGFVAGLVVMAKDFLREGEKLFLQCPIDRMCFYDATRVRAKLFASPLLAKLTTLAFTSKVLGLKGVEMLAESPHLANLTTLILYGQALGIEGAMALGASPHLPILAELDLSLNLLGSAGATALASTINLPKLTRLNLATNGIGAEGIKSLADSPALANLTALDLSRNNIGDDGVKALTSSPHLTSLTDLNLSDTMIEDNRAKVLAESPHLAGLVALDLSSNWLWAKGVAALASSPHLGKLRYLNLSANSDVRVAGVRSLLESALPDRLEILDLQGCRLPSPRKNPAVRELKARMGGRLFLDDR